MLKDRHAYRLIASSRGESERIGVRPQNSGGKSQWQQPNTPFRVGKREYRARRDASSSHPGNETAALLSAFATYAAGFLIRPFGAVIFGRIGDLVGRKYTFLMTIIIMGFSTFAVGLLPTFAEIGWTAPILLVSLRLLQGLALGGEYGGAATYVAEHARPGQRGYSTAWIQTTATLGFFLALLVIGICRFYFFDAKEFAAPGYGAGWGWPF